MAQKLVVALFVSLLLAFSVTAQNRFENVILITLDGARNQEIFGGLDRKIFASAKKDFDKSPVYKKFWAETAKERREKLMPFFWGTLMRSHGSIAGNRELKSIVHTTNKLWFSYPGYSEILTGQSHDDVVNSNDFGQNPYPSVLDFLHRKLKLDANQVAAFGSWDAFARIATSKPGSFLVNAGYKAYDSDDREIALLSRIQTQTLSPWNGVRFDYYTTRFALAHMKKFRPRVMYIALDETDDWAHNKNYERVLDALKQTDDFLKELWDFVQADPAYKSKTHIVITVDHGRGADTTDWSDHGEDVPEAQYIWMAFISPAVPIRGEWENSQTIYQNQVAATLSRFLNLDYSEQNREAGKPVERLFK